VSKVLSFKDLNISFKPHPITGDLVVSKDVAAIKQAIRTLLLTNKGERLFQPDLGSDISRYLFEPLDFSIAGLVKSSITDLMNRYEPRVILSSISVVPDFDNNGLDVDMIVELIGREDEPIGISFFLDRTR